MEIMVHNCKQSLLFEINNLRNLLIEIGLKKGLQSEETIRISEKLDILIVQYQKITN